MIGEFDIQLSRFLVLLRSENLLIKYQTCLLLGNLIVLNYKFADVIMLNKIYEVVLGMEGLFLDKQLLFYHSWLVSCLSYRYSGGQMDLWVQRYNDASFNKNMYSGCACMA